MKKCYLWVKGGYEGACIGERIYLSKGKAVLDLLKEQDNPDSPYYNHPTDDFQWYVDELDFDYTI